MIFFCICQEFHTAFIKKTLQLQTSYVASLSLAVNDPIRCDGNDVGFKKDDYSEKELCHFFRGYHIISR